MKIKYYEQKMGLELDCKLKNKKYKKYISELKIKVYKQKMKFEVNGKLKKIRNIKNVKVI